MNNKIELDKPTPEQRAAAIAELKTAIRMLSETRARAARVVTFSVFLSELMTRLASKAMGFLK